MNLRWSAVSNEKRGEAGREERYHIIHEKMEDAARAVATQNAKRAIGCGMQTYSADAVNKLCFLYGESRFSREEFEHRVRPLTERERELDEKLEQEVRRLEEEHKQEMQGWRRRTSETWTNFMSVGWRG